MNFFLNVFYKYININDFIIIIEIEEFKLINILLYYK